MYLPICGGNQGLSGHVSTDPSSIIEHSPCVLVKDDVLQQVEAKAKHKGTLYLTNVDRGVQTENWTTQSQVWLAVPKTFKHFSNN